MLCRLLLIAQILMLLPIVCYGDEVYKSYDSRGNPVYSDKPQNDKVKPESIDVKDPTTESDSQQEITKQYLKNSQQQAQENEKRRQELQVKIREAEIVLENIKKARDRSIIQRKQELANCYLTNTNCMSTINTSKLELEVAKAKSNVENLYLELQKIPR